MQKSKTDLLLGSRISGGNSAYGRSQSDYYPTPPDATKALIHYLNISKDCIIWEPACGQGHMLNVFLDNGYCAFGTDVQTGTDFLNCDIPNFDWIITNPPFSLAEQFIRRAWEIRKPFAFLLKIQYWNAQKRFELFKECQPSIVLPIGWRLDFTGKGNALMDTQWCVWDIFDSHSTYYQPLSKPM